MRSAAVGSTLVRGRRGFRLNECSQDLSDTAGNPFPVYRGPEVSLFLAESTSGSDYATEFVPPE